MFQVIRNNKSLFILLLSLMIQFISIPFAGTHVKIFMLVTTVYVFLGLKYIRVASFYTFESLWFLTYAINGLSIIWAGNASLGFQLFVGQLLLLVFYIVLKYHCLKSTGLTEVIYIVFRTFVIISILLYVVGLVFIYIFQNYDYAVILNEHSLRVFGCYKETNLPRLMGLAESPNNYAYFADFAFCFFLWKKRFNDAILTSITLILTLSTSIWIVFAIQLLLYINTIRHLVKFKHVIVITLLFYGLYRILDSLPDKDLIIQDRMVRNSTGSGRFELWSNVFEMSEQRPFFGYGINQIRLFLQERGYQSAHNNYLDTLFSNGLIGISVYFCFIISLFRKCIYFTKKYDTLFFIQLFILFFVAGLSNNTLHIEFTPFLLCMISVFSYKIQAK